MTPVPCWGAVEREPRRRAYLKAALSQPSCGTEARGGERACARARPHVRADSECVRPCVGTELLRQYEVCNLGRTWAFCAALALAAPRA